MSFYEDVIHCDARFHSAARINDMALLEPVTRAAVEAIMRDAAAAWTPLLVFETYRSQARQEALFNHGATQLRRVGVHGFGLAADLVKDINGEPSWKGDFAFLAALARKHGLISGLDWGMPGVPHSFIDACHVQRITVADQARLFVVPWYPEPTYSPWTGVPA